ncbi:LCP family protein, partial [Kitasatospora viridis]
PPAPAPPAPPAPRRPRQEAPKPAPAAEPAPERSEMVGGSRPAGRPKTQQDSYQTGEFTFVDEEAEESEDVIDWLKFAESRSERRDERRRKLRTRLLAGAVALLLVGGGTVGYLWANGTLFGSPTAAQATGGRNVVVVHLHELTGKVSTALLVNDSSGHKGSILLLPDTLQLPSPNGGTVDTGDALNTIGAAPVRDALATMLGAPVKGTWRLDTPYLQLLVSQIGGIKVDTDVQITGPDGKVLVEKGSQRTLTGDAAVAYATYQGQGETRDTQLRRFGQVLSALIAAMPNDLPDAQDDVHRIGAVLDPSLPEQALAGVLVQLNQQSAAGHLSTSELPVKPDGSIDEATAGAMVKQVLGGTVHTAAVTNAPARVGLVDATGTGGNAQSAQTQVINAGLTFVPNGGTAPAQAASEIRYTDDARAAAAHSLAQSLGLPDSAVKKVTDPQTVDLLVVLGKDYQPPKTQ